MANVNSTNTPEGAQQQARDAQTLDDLTSLQQAPEQLDNASGDAKVAPNNEGDADNPSMTRPDNEFKDQRSLPEGGTPDDFRLEVTNLNNPDPQFGGPNPNQPNQTVGVVIDNPVNLDNQQVVLDARDANNTGPRGGPNAPVNSVTPITPPEQPTTNAPPVLPTAPTPSPTINPPIPTDPTAGPEADPTDDDGGDNDSGGDQRSELVVYKSATVYDSVEESNLTSDIDGILDSEGDVIRYSIIVGNTGTSALFSLNISDPLLSDGPIKIYLGSYDSEENTFIKVSADGVTVPSFIQNDGNLYINAVVQNGQIIVDANFSLASNSALMFEYDYSVTQEDLDRQGKDVQDVEGTLSLQLNNDDDIDNIVKVSAVDANNTELNDDANSNIVIERPNIVVTKLANLESVSAVGDEIEYTVTVRNDGNVALSNVQITDLLVKNLAYDSGDLDEDEILDVGETWAYKGSYVVTQDDLDRKADDVQLDVDGKPQLAQNTDGFIDNIVTVSATSPGDKTLQNQDSEKVELKENPSILVVKIADTEVASFVGQEIIYIITVENNGNVALSNVQVTDLLVKNLAYDSGDIDEDAVLDVGETWTYKGTYEVSLDDLTGQGLDVQNVEGSLSLEPNTDDFIDNTVTVSAETPDEDIVTKSASESVSIAPAEVSIEKNLVNSAKLPYGISHVLFFVKEEGSNGDLIAFKLDSYSGDEKDPSDPQRYIAAIEKYLSDTHDSSYEVVDYYIKAATYFYDSDGAKIDPSQVIVFGETLLSSYIGNNNSSSGPTYTSGQVGSQLTLEEGTSSLVDLNVSLSDGETLSIQFSGEGHFFLGSDPTKTPLIDLTNLTQSQIDNLWYQAPSITGNRLYELNFTYDILSAVPVTDNTSIDLSTDNNIRNDISVGDLSFGNVDSSSVTSVTFEGFDSNDFPVGLTPSLYYKDNLNPSGTHYLVAGDEIPLEHINSLKVDFVGSNEVFRSVSSSIRFSASFEYQYSDSLSESQTFELFIYPQLSGAGTSGSTAFNQKIDDGMSASYAESNYGPLSVIDYLLNYKLTYEVTVTNEGYAQLNDVKVYDDLLGSSDANFDSTDGIQIAAFSGSNQFLGYVLAQPDTESKYGDWFVEIDPTWLSVHGDQVILRYNYYLTQDDIDAKGTQSNLESPFEEGYDDKFYYDENGTQTEYYSFDNVATILTKQTSPVTAVYSYPIAYTPELSINKSAAVTNGANSGLIDADDSVADTAYVNSTDDTITYTITVQNTGNVDLTGVKIYDTMFSRFLSSDQLNALNVDSSNGQLATGIKIGAASQTVYKDGGGYYIVLDPLTMEANDVAVNITYTITTTEVATLKTSEGAVIGNTAGADSDQTTLVTDYEVVKVVTPELSINKSAAVTNGANSGLIDADDSVADTAYVNSTDDTITYTITVQNTGNVDLTGVKIYDTMFSRFLSSDQLNALNVDSSNGQLATGIKIGAASQTVYKDGGGYYIVLDPLTMEANDVAVNITYTITTTEVATLKTSEGAVIGNTAGADSDQTTLVTDYEVVKVVTPELSINKSAAVTNGANSGLIDADDSVADTAYVNSTDDTITYTITVQNTGNVDLTGVKIYDTMFSRFLSSDQLNALNVDSSNGQLATGIKIGAASQTVYKDGGGYYIVLDPLTMEANDVAVNITYTITTTEVATLKTSEGAVIGNTAGADSDQTTLVTDYEVVKVVTPELSINKSAAVTNGANSGLIDADDSVADTAYVNSTDDTITYTITVQNTGNVDLTGVKIYDTMFSRFLSSDQLNALNVDSSNGQLATGIKIGAASQTVYKDGGGYYIVLDPLTMEANDVAVNITYTITTTEVATLKTSEGAVIGNTAGADSDQTTLVTDYEVVKVVTPELSINKSAAVTNGANSGLIDADDSVADTAYVNSTDDTITYTITVQNTGNVDLTGVKIYDTMFSRFLSSDQLNALNVDSSNGQLATGIKIGAASQTVYKDGGGYYIVLDPLTMEANDVAVNITYTITTTEVATLKTSEGAVIGNTAGADSDQTTLVTDYEVVKVVTPELSINKSAAVTNGANSGLIDADDSVADTAYVNSTDDTITYTITVQNTGNVDLTGVKIYDTMFSRFLSSDQLNALNVDSSNGQLATGIKIGAASQTVYKDGGGYYIVLDPLTMEANDVAVNITYTITTTEVATLKTSEGAVIGNTAGADSDQTTLVTDYEVVKVVTPGINVIKTATVFNDINLNNIDGDNKFDSSSDYIKYVVRVQNTGNQDLTGITLIDNKIYGSLKAGGGFYSDGDSVILKIGHYVDGVFLQTTTTTGTISTGGIITLNNTFALDVGYEIQLQYVYDITVTDLTASVESYMLADTTSANLLTYVSINGELTLSNDGEEFGKISAYVNDDISGKVSSSVSNKYGMGGDPKPIQVSKDSGVTLGVAGNTIDGTVKSIQEHLKVDFIDSKAVNSTNFVFTNIGNYAEVVLAVKFTDGLIRLQSFVFDKDANTYTSGFSGSSSGSGNVVESASNYIGFTLNINNSTAYNSGNTGGSQNNIWTISYSGNKNIDWADFYVVGNSTNDNSSIAVKVIDFGFSNIGTIDPINNTATADSDQTNSDSDTASVSYLNLANPIVIDLDGYGVNYIPSYQGVAHDFDGDGVTESTAWVSPEDGLLALSREDGSLKIVFSTQDGETDLQGLAKIYDSNQDGQLDELDAFFNEFGIWQDADSDGVVDSGEFQSLTDRGIVSLDLVSDGMERTEANGDIFVYGQTTYTKADGTTGLADDAAFVIKPSGEAITKTIQIGNSGEVVHVPDFGTNDQIDLSTILANAAITRDNLKDYVQLVDGENGTVLNIDTTGHGGEGGWVQVVSLDNVHVNQAGVNMFFDPTNQTIDFTQSSPNEWKVEDGDTPI